MATVTFKKVASAQRVYALYAPDKRAEYEVLVDGIVAGRIRARHIHAASWSWRFLVDGREVEGDGTLRHLKARLVKRFDKGV